MPGPGARPACRGACWAGWRLTDLLAGLHLFTGAPRTVGESAATARTTAVGTTAVGTTAVGTTAVGTGPGVGSAGPTTGGGVGELSDASRDSILDPLGLGRPAPRVGRPRPVLLPFLAAAGASPPPASSSAPGPAARQVDETTCGAAVLTMLAMAGDPRLATKIARDPGPRFVALQRRVHRASARGRVPWPRAWGTAPWAAAALARYGDVRYGHRVVGGAGARAVLGAVVAAARQGTPVPLYVGGDLAGGWQAAVPRHVVLLAAGAGDEVRGIVRIYEPSSATMHAVPVRLLLGDAADDADVADADAGAGAGGDGHGDAARAADRAVRTAALGWWPHVVWAVLPMCGRPAGGGRWAGNHRSAAPSLRRRT